MRGGGVSFQLSHGENSSNEAKECDSPTAMSQSRLESGLASVQRLSAAPGNPLFSGERRHAEELYFKDTGDAEMKTDEMCVFLAATEIAANTL